MSVYYTSVNRNPLAPLVESVVQLVPTVVQQLMRFRLFDWHNVSRGPSATAELRVKSSVGGSVESSRTQFTPPMPTRRDGLVASCRRRRRASDVLRLCRSDASFVGAADPRQDGRHHRRRVPADVHHCRCLPSHRPPSTKTKTTRRASRQIRYVPVRRNYYTLEVYPRSRI